MFKLPFFVSTINWSDISFSIHQKLLWILSANLIQDYQFKYTSHCLCFFYPELFLFSEPTLHIKEWKGSCKEFLFVRLFFKSDNISHATFRGAWVNDITKNCAAYREIPPFVPELFVYSHMSNGSLLSGKTKSSGKGIEEIYFVGTAWTDNSEDLMIHLLIWNSAVSG